LGARVVDAKRACLLVVVFFESDLLDEISQARKGACCLTFVLFHKNYMLFNFNAIAPLPFSPFESHEKKNGILSVRKRYDYIQLLTETRQ
jgi:hypothetical protein